jgi:hypothetical protein
MSDAVRWDQLDGTVAQITSTTGRDQDIYKIEYSMCP